MSRTLITKLSTDLANANDEMIEAMKLFMRATFMQSGFKAIEFEVVEDDDACTVERLLQSVRNEFQECDGGSDEQ